MLRQKSLKNNPTSIKKRISNQCFIFDWFWSQLGPILGRFWGLRWSQVGTKSLPKSICKLINKNHPILARSRARFWAPTRPPRGDPGTDFWKCFLPLRVSCGEDPSKTLPRGPQGPQETPKTPPRSHQDHPKTPQGPLKMTPRPPKTPPDPP